MAKTINIQPPTLRFGVTPIGSIQVTITEGATTIANRFYLFSLSNFSAVVDEVAQNYAQLHFGAHVLDISNGNFSTYLYAGAPVLNSYQLALAVAEAVGDLA